MFKMECAAYEKSTGNSSDVQHTVIEIQVYSSVWGQTKGGDLQVRVRWTVKPEEWMQSPRETVKVETSKQNFQVPIYLKGKGLNPN